MRFKIILCGFFFVLYCLAQGYSAPARSGIINLVYGTCEVQREGKWIKAGAKFAIYPGDVVRSGDKSKVEIKFDEGSIVRLSEKTEMKINNLSLNVDKKEYKTSVTGKVGNIWSRVKKISGYKNNFETATPTAIAGVRSTVYRLKIDEDTTTMVRVYKGRVEVKTWIEAYENMIKTRGKKEEPTEEQGFEQPYEVEGPYEVSMEEWMQIVSAMQQVIISPNQMPKEATKFDPEEDAKDPWVIWNMQRDTQLEKEGK